MKDKPDEWIWGNSGKFGYDPNYDFDCYKLWSFLCAYYYDFDSANGDIKYWSYNSGTETLLQELFDSEYQFEYHYDNTSHWEYKNCFVSKGYYSIEGSGVTGEYGYIQIKYPDALPFSDFNNDKTIYFNLSNGEVLNYNDGYSATGWYLKNQFVDDYDPDGNKYGAWYTDGETCSYGIYDGGVLKIPIPYVIPEKDWCSFLQKYDWITDCRLYYNVKQKKTFDEVIEDKLKGMSHADERVEYYKLLAGLDSSTMYGNHQTLKNMTEADSIREETYSRVFGYEMTEWNTESDGLYEGIKISYPSGSKLYAPFDCKITDVDAANHKITLRKGNRGKRLTTRAIYGYKKNPDDSSEWLIDEAVCPIVQMIFKMYAEGTSITKIARHLESERILKPSAYAGCGSRSAEETEDGMYIWSPQTIISMLGKREYCGDTVNFRTTKKSFKSKEIIYNGEDKIKIFPDTHQAIISRELFELVQERLKKRKRMERIEDTPLFASMIFCADCQCRMHLMRTRKNKTDSYVCSSYRKSSKNSRTCTSHYVRVDVLSREVLNQIQLVQIDYLKDKEAFRQKVIERMQMEELIERESIDSIY